MKNAPDSVSFVAAADSRLAKDELRVFAAYSNEDLRQGLSWCTKCLVVVHFSSTLQKWVADTGGLDEPFHRGHVLEEIHPNDFPNLTAPGYRGRVARLAYQMARRLTPEDILRIVAKSRQKTRGTNRPAFHA